MQSRPSSSIPKFLNSPRSRRGGRRRGSRAVGSSTAVVPVSVNEKGLSRIHQFVRTGVSNVSIGQNAAGLDTLAAFKFRLSDLTNSTEFTNLFDEYRIVKVELTFRWDHAPATVGAALNLGVPPFYTVVDYDDASTPAVITDLFQYESCKMWDLSKGPAVVVVHPKISTAAYGAGVFTSYTNTRSWVDNASPSVDHYGAKYGFQTSLWGAGGPTYYGYLTTVEKVFLECRDVM
jgi:hypothetical protein